MILSSSLYTWEPANTLHSKDATAILQGVFIFIQFLASSYCDRPGPHPQRPQATR